MFSMPYSQNVYFLIYRLVYGADRVTSKGVGVRWGGWGVGGGVLGGGVLGWGGEGRNSDLRAIWFGCEPAVAIVLRF